MGKAFALTSGKGGVGKSSVCVGLALAFAKTGKKVLLVDLDEGLRCLDLMLGVDKSAVFDLSDILCGKEIEDAVYTCPFNENISLIPAPQKTGLIDAFSFTAFAKQVTELYDIVLFDFPAGISLELYPCLPKDTLFLTVAVPDPVSVRDAAVISQRLGEMSLEARLIINRFVFKGYRKYNFKNIDEIIDSAVLRLVGIVPESEEIALFTVKHKLSRRGRVVKAFSRIAARLEGENRLLPKIKKI